MCCASCGAEALPRTLCPRLRRGSVLSYRHYERPRSIHSGYGITFYMSEPDKIAIKTKRSPL